MTYVIRQWKLCLEKCCEHYHSQCKCQPSVQLSKPTLQIQNVYLTCVIEDKIILKKNNTALMKMHEKRSDSESFLKGTKMTKKGYISLICLGFSAGV